MFNFFEEIKNKARKNKVLSDYNIILISGKLLYIEGHIGLVNISPTLIVLKVRGARIEIVGENLYINELTENTMTIEGNVGEVKKYE